MLAIGPYDRDRRRRFWARRASLTMCLVVSSLIGTLAAQCWMLIQMGSPAEFSTEESREFSQDSQPNSQLSSVPFQESTSQSLSSLHFQNWKTPADSRCGAIFGNGFDLPISRCAEVICDQNTLTHATLCSVQDLVVDRTKIAVSAGGEAIEDVIGRDESNEFPVYSSGAFSTTTFCSFGDISANRFPHHLASMVRSFTPGASMSSCDDRVTLFVTRYEYANLYHTMTDWYNAYQAWALVANSTTAPQIVFMDGHSQGALDPVWATLFGSAPKFVSTLPASSCFRHAVLVPAGYTGALSVDSMNAADSCTAMPLLRKFATWFVTRFELGHILPSKQSPRILFILRRDYLAHPRNPGRSATRKIRNEKELLDRVASAFPQATIVASEFENYTFVEQIRAVRSASVLVGVHGAALSHVLFADSSATLLELMPPEYSARHHFLMLAKYSNVGYERSQIGSETVGGFHDVPVEEVIHTLRRIISS